MKKYITLLLFCLTLFIPSALKAQEGETTIEFVASKTVLEDDPNKNNYNITLFSPDGEWKMQINYYAPSMFGTFGNQEFRLDGDGRYYNYVRNPKNDMVFYSFVDMNVTVANEGNCYRVNANCLTNNKMRFIVEGTIPAPKPQSSVSDSLGYARLEPNAFYGTYAIHAENDNYKLSYGIVGDKLTGTFYRADILMPELYDKKAGKAITITNATAEHRKKGETTYMKLTLLSEDLVEYQLTMFNGPYDIEIKEERDIFFNQVFLQDISEMYGCYQIGAQNDEYMMSIAITTQAFESGRLQWTKDDMIMQYTQLIRSADNNKVDIFDIKVRLEPGNKLVMIYADVTTMEGILYHITMRYEEDGFIPEAGDTVQIDFGHVSVLDYSKGLGIVGLGAVKPGKYQMRAYLNAYKLEGEFTTSDFVMDMCDVMVVSGSTYVFHDAKYVNASMENVDGKTRINIDMLAVDGVLYRGTMYIDDLRCMHDGEYAITPDDGVLMMALQEGGLGGKYNYTMQLQNLDEVYDEDYNVIGDGYIFSFNFDRQGPGIQGTYSIGEGTLSEDEQMTFFENRCEVRLGIVACTLELKAVQPLTINFDGQIIQSNVYSIDFKALGQNGAIFSGKGENYLLCINEDGEFQDITEDYEDAINDILAAQGMKVRKVLKDGKILIEKADKEYDLSGKMQGE